jgi:hypothetical protein
MDKELVAEWFKFADDDIDTVLLLKKLDITNANAEKAVKYALEVRDFNAIIELRTELEIQS